MMFNSTESFIILGGYLPFGPLNYLYFTILAMIYLSIVVSNTFVIVVICMNKSLHEPMYLFLCSLFVGELFGSTGLFPFLLIQVLSDVHTVPASSCFLQIFCIHSYGNIEICNLAVMSYDRYVAICCPLQYHRRMTTQRALVVITVVWLYSFVRVLITVALNLRLARCGNYIDKVRCANFAIVRLACSDIRVNHIYGLFGTALSLGVPLIPVLFSYLSILKVCFSGSKQTRMKAISTCSPQLFSLVNYFVGCFMGIFQGRVNLRVDQKISKFLLSEYYLIFPPIVNPLMFGLQMTKIRKACTHHLTHKIK